MLQISLKLKYLGIICLVFLVEFTHLNTEIT